MSLGDLCDRHRLIGYIPDLLYAPELSYLNEIDERLRASLRSSSINAQHAMVAAGGGIGVLPAFVGESDPSLVRILPGLKITRSFWMVTHRDNVQLRRIQAFKAWLEAVVAARSAQLI